MDSLLLNKNIAGFLLVIITLLPGGGKAIAASESGREQLRILAVSPVIADITRQVGGSEVDVTSLLSPGVDPHAYEVTPGKMRGMAEADLVIANGLGFESMLPGFQEIFPAAKLLVLGERISDPIRAGTHSHEHEHEAADHDKAPFDPHWWHSVGNVKAAAVSIRDRLIQLRPEASDAFQKNTAHYLKELDKLARWIRIQIATIPRKDRILLMSHDALAYFARDYGFTILPIRGANTLEQPSSQEVQELIKKIQELRVPIIFSEAVENPKVAREITQETGVAFGPPLYTDNLGNANDDAGTYIGMMRYNVQAVVNGLGSTKIPTQP